MSTADTWGAAKNTCSRHALRRLNVAFRAGTLPACALPRAGPDRRPGLFGLIAGGMFLRAVLQLRDPSPAAAGGAAEEPA